MNIAKLLFAVALTLVAGCTAFSLERHAANQAMTVTEMRYQLIFDNLAKMASNRGNLPSYGNASDGTAAVTDSVALDVATAFAPQKSAGSKISGNANRSPQLQWTIDPVHTPSQMLALQLAYNWALTSTPPNEGSADKQLLEDFAVYDDLECLVSRNPDWFCTGCKDAVPKNTCYVANYCGTYAWLSSGGMHGLSEFTLIVTDIATIDPSTIQLMAMLSFDKAEPKSIKDRYSKVQKNMRCIVHQSPTTNEITDIFLAEPIVLYQPMKEDPIVHGMNTSCPPDLITESRRGLNARGSVPYTASPGMIQAIRGPQYQSPTPANGPQFK